MAEQRFDGRTVCGLLVATLVAPFIVAFTLGLLAAPSNPLFGFGLGTLAIIVVLPLSALVTFLIGIPAILLARRLRTRSAWYYAGCGLVAGPIEVLVSRGNATAFDIAALVAGGLAASLVYWLIAERGRAKGTETDI